MKQIENVIAKAIPSSEALRVECRGLRKKLGGFPST